MLIDYNATINPFIILNTLWLILPYTNITKRITFTNEYKGDMFAYTTCYNNKTVELNFLRPFMNSNIIWQGYITNHEINHIKQCQEGFIGNITKREDNARQRG